MDLWMPWSAGTQMDSGDHVRRRELAYPIQDPASRKGYLTTNNNNALGHHRQTLAFHAQILSCLSVLERGLDPY